MASAQAEDQFDVFGGFMAEIEGYLPAIAANLRRLLTQPGDEDLLEESHRFAHTIKSSAAMMGMPELRKLAAPMEALLARAYAGEAAITPSVVETVDGTLAGVRRYLDGARNGAAVAALLAENDRAYAELSTTAPATEPTPSQDAGDRLAHLEDAAFDELNMLLASGAPIDDSLALPTERRAAPSASEPPSDPAEAVDDRSPAEAADIADDQAAASAGAAALAAGEHDDSPETALEDAPEESGTADPIASRPRLTMVAGGPPAADEAERSASLSSIAAEWLAELLGPDAAPAADERPGPEAAKDAPPLVPVVPVGEVDRLLAESEQAWQARLTAERARFAQELERERRQAEERLQRQAEQHQRVLAAAAADRQQALDTQRIDLEEQVRHYIDDELRPQLEEELRDELAHEFEVAALLESDGAAPRPAKAAAARRPAATADAALAAEMEAIFAQEADEHLQAIGEYVLALRDRPDDADQLHALRRSVHTLKGAAATVGLRVVSDLCHQVESALDQSLEANQAPEPATFHLLLQSCDAIEGLVRHADAAEVRAFALMQELSPLTGLAAPSPDSALSADREASAEAAPPSTADLAAVSIIPAPAAALAVPAASAAASQVIDVPPAPEPASRAPAGLALRVTLDQLDRMLATNHELIISGSAAEQRLQRLGRIVGDLRHAGGRLRTAGARLEKSRELAALLAGGASWEALPALLPAATVPAAAGANAAETTWRAALARRADQAGEHGEFDALELDRYTEFHRLAREVAEAALDVSTLDGEIEGLLDDMRQVVKQQQHLHTQQNDVLLKVRMLPVRTLIPRVERAVQTVAGIVGKEVEFVVDGENTLLDRAVIEAIADALLHLARNAVDHGIETAEERLAAGKPAHGTIRLQARREGADVVLTLGDDGAGLDLGRIWQKAVERGLVSADGQPTDAEITRLIFAPGMSTAQEVTDISGRGVGLDVVRANLQAARGSVEVASEPGRGTTFTLRVPVSLSLLAVSLVECAGDTYAIPLTLVRHVEKLPARRVQQTEQGLVVRHGPRSYPVVELAGALGRAAAPVERAARRPFVFVRSHGGVVALAVDRLVGKREVVVKDLGGHLRAVKGVHGATVLGNGDLVLILDVPGLLSAEAPEHEAPAAAPRRQRQLLVVDDSPSVRRLTAAVFERQGWQTRPARDGMEAIDVLREWRPDAVVTDIEMPRMDGFELLAILRRQAETAELPVVIVTSRAGEKHREKARSLGVNGYLVKPFREEELLATVEGTLLAGVEG